MSKVKPELRRFILSGILAVTVDLLTYQMLVNYLNYDLAKALSFICGTIVAFIANKYFTFKKYKKRNKEIWQFALVYVATLTINVAINRFVLDVSQIVFLGFLAATACSAILNFLGQKFWVFK
ncbi:GtrA family protein [Gammaproteobacteria bacterium]|nr:GtrA family protein [Gammaproteobacteria bacterium]